MSTTIKLYRSGSSFCIHLAGKSAMERHTTRMLSFLDVVAPCEAAYGVMVDAKDILRHSPIFKHDVKYHVNRALKMYTSMQYRVFAEMSCTRKYWLDYMDAFDELIKPLLDRLLRGITKVLVDYRKESYGKEKAIMLTAWNLLDISLYAFEIYFRGETQMKKKSPIRLIRDIRREWKLAIEAIEFDRNIDLSKYKNVVKVTDNIYELILDENTVNVCGDKALQLNPDRDIRLKQKRNQI